MPTSYCSFHLGHPMEAEITPLTRMDQLRQVWGASRWWPSTASMSGGRGSNNWGDNDEDVQIDIFKMSILAITHAVLLLIVVTYNSYCTCWCFAWVESRPDILWMQLLTDSTRGSWGGGIVPWLQIEGQSTLKWLWKGQIDGFHYRTTTYRNCTMVIMFHLDTQLYINTEWNFN